MKKKKILINPLNICNKLLNPSLKVGLFSFNKKIYEIGFWGVIVCSGFMWFFSEMLMLHVFIGGLNDFSSSLGKHINLDKIIDISE